MKPWFRYFGFHIVEAVYFAVSCVAAYTVYTPSPYRWWTPILFGLAAVSVTGMLVRPDIRWLRIAAVLIPLAAAGARLLGVLDPHHRQIAAVINWTFITFILGFVGPRVMPPPLANGERREWLNSG